MGKSKPSMPPPDPMEIELANIGRDVAGDYQTNYRPMNAQLLNRASVDRSDLAAGQATVDAQMAASNQMNNALTRATTSGGLGSGASISLVDAGATGGAIQSAGSSGYSAGRQNYADRLQGAVNAVQAGQDTSAQGLRTAADIASRDALEEYNHSLAMDQLQQQGVAQAIGAVGTGMFKRRLLGDTTTNRAPNYGFVNPFGGITNTVSGAYNNALGAPIDQMYLGEIGNRGVA